MNLLLTLLPQNFTIHRLPPNADIPPLALSSLFFAMTRTDDELSIVLPETVLIESEISEPDWACLKVEGPLDFGLVGILAGMSQTLAEAKVSIFAISTYETDYILVKQVQLETAIESLLSAGYSLRR